MDVSLGLFLGEGSEEVDLLLAGCLPLVVGLECVLKMLLDVHIERLGLKLRVWRIVDTWNCLC